MAYLMPNEILYGICQQVTTIDTAAAFTATAKGMDYGDHCIPLTNIGVNFAPGQQFVDVRKAHGGPYRKAGTGYEYPKGIQTPTTTLEFDADAWSMSLFFWLLCHAGSSEAAHVYTFTDWDGVGCATEVWASVVEQMSGALTDSRAIHGCIVRDLTLSAEVGSALKCSANMVGYQIDDDYDCSTGSKVWTFAERAPLMWQDATVELNTNPVNIDGFTLALSNNAVTKHYDAQYPVKHILGDLTGTGEIVIPWGTATEGGKTQLTDFLAGTIGRLEIYWGHDLAGIVADGELALDLRIRRTDAERVVPDEVGTRIPFEICQTSTNGPFDAKLQATMTASRGIA